jgi:hypothetical protein
MTTQLFLRDDVTATPYQFSTGNNDAPLGTASWGATTAWANAWLVKDVRGSGVSFYSRATIASNATGIEIGTTQPLPLAFISAPIDQDVTISGTITFNLWMGENTTSVNAGAMCVVQRITSTGAIGATIASSAKGTELPKISAIAAQNWTVAATSTAMLKGDRIRVRVVMKNVGTMGTDSVGCQLNVNGTTAAASGDSYVTFNETFGFLTTDPTTTTLYPTGTIAGINPGAATELEMWTSRGSGSATSDTDTVTGWTAPIQIRNTVNSADWEWYSKPLTAFTLAAPVLVNVRASENNVSANVSMRAELAVTAGDGTSPVVWGGTTDLRELTTTDAAYQFYIAGDDVAVTNGQRLRLRLFIDDSATAAMATGFKGNPTVNGTSAGAAGDTYLIFGQTLTEFSGGGATSLAVPRRDPSFALRDFDPWAMGAWT